MTTTDVKPDVRVWRTPSSEPCWTVARCFDCGWRTQERRRGAVLASVEAHRCDDDGGGEAA